MLAANLKNTHSNIYILILKKTKYSGQRYPLSLLVDTRVVSIWKSYIALFSSYYMALRSRSQLFLVNTPTVEFKLLCFFILELLHSGTLVLPARQDDDNTTSAFYSWSKV